MSTKYDALIEKMARAICLAEGRDPDLKDNNVADGVFLPNWMMFCSAAIHALAVARKAILEEAAGAVEHLIDTDKIRRECCGNGVQSTFDEPPECCGDPDLLVTIDDAARAIRSLANQEHPQ